MTAIAAPALAGWLTCRRCTLHKTRRQVVLGRGVMPAEILFIGEAPGRSEDLVGEAFVGRAGKILDEGIKDAVALAKLPAAPTYFITNVVGCIPVDIKGGPFREPTREEAQACWGRVDLTYRLVAPTHVILLGAVAAAHAGPYFPGAAHLRHPAYILRRGGTASTEYRTFVRELGDIFQQTHKPAELKRRDTFGEKIR